ncbi:Uncharacterized FlgJ-related protein [Alteromonadaceae bacterium Bs31]|nr:Uncharacterized FlgJ-related protein [Alteromonadaceae bacterium Bs31]
MALAQAANESSWGRSRFAIEGHNYFGQWCFKSACGFVPKHRPSEAKHEVRRFSSTRQSVAAYLFNINSHEAYKNLRQLRADLRSSKQPLSGIALAQGLGKYSERGDEYITELREMIRVNGLE